MGRIKGGIYQWRSLVNEKIYIGSTVYFNRRKHAHLVKLRKNIHENKKLQNSFNKHGEKSLVFEVVEIIENKELLIEREQYFINTLAPIFNVCKVAGRTTGVTAWNKGNQMPKDVIAKQQATKKSRTYEKKTISDEHKKAISIKNSGRKKTIEQIESFRQRVKNNPPWNKGIKSGQINGNRKPVLQFSLQGEFLAEYPSIYAAEQAIGCRTNIINACREGRVSKGFLWKYKVA